jgi:hypothetical protein
MVGPWLLNSMQSTIPQPLIELMDLNARTLFSDRYAFRPV